MPKDAISALLARTDPPVQCPDVAAWWPRWRALAAAASQPFERAVLGGAEADRLGWAFASGYQAALRSLVPSLPDDAIAALCVTEAEGNFPRAIRTSLTPQGAGFALSGEKRWTTLGPGGGLFIVIAREAGSDAARPSLKAEFYGIYEDNDPSKRLMMIVNYNTDISQYWEWSGTGLRPIDDTNEAYKLGVNYLLYGLTH